VSSLMKHHPVSQIFPLMGKAELRELSESIKRNGLREAILIDADQRIIDGRNRYSACRLARVEPKFKQCSIKDPAKLAEFVWDSNHVRRQLTQSQRDAAGANMQEFIEKTTKAARNRSASAGGKAKANSAVVSADTTAAQAVGE
jgi:hypothetical protein